ncbi:MAG: phage tail protein [Gammaproteobacteria bacterium]|nr:phage tail protein [Gammaproteobacteria bacterium]
MSEEQTPSTELILGFRFGVFFFPGGGNPNPLDIRFKKVSGLSAEVSTLPHTEGGQNLYTHRLPERIEYNNLILERGMIVGSPLSVEFTTTLALFKFNPSNVMVTLFGEERTPLSAWLFIKAYPVRWSVSDLNAEDNSLVIDTMELAYTRMQILST